ncbi:pseudouridine-5'-phosphate glycosidase [Tautonia marina]|uniref:pseudouridine-5'-phosphate glycosidase n=1 Tax=Tautonia marina TaxID=2653855 RepID=UPI0012608F30|nr:pseudouridine-5'-phosphate glycosidase [Tautonia marina]
MNAFTEAIALDIAHALQRGQPVVALESTLIAHGLPWPTNLETARRSEQAVREAGAVPATIAVLNGRVRIGLSDTELTHLAQANDVLKAGRRDLSPVLARGQSAATTVSATLWIARSAGIGVFATGGLGGVHRNAAESFDVSMDLDELARADGSLVVCSGAKTVLDLPATLEALETRGVPIIGYQTDALPAFTSRTTGLPLEHRVNDPVEAARLVAVHRQFGLPCAVVLTQQVPESEAPDEALMNAALDDALNQADRLGISGKRLTPFLLARIHEGTGGMSQSANAALIVANASLAARVAVELARIAPNGPEAGAG